VNSFTVSVRASGLSSLRGLSATLRVPSDADSAHSEYGQLVIRSKPMTPKEKRWLAVRNVVDPFNAITILGDAGIAVGSNAYSPYGPGMPGFGRCVGVSYSQDMTGEFFGTFLIPSIVHQGPRTTTACPTPPSRAGQVMPFSRWCGPRATTARRW
jgi:hypothetical protein